MYLVFSAFTSRPTSLPESIKVFCGGEGLQIWKVAVNALKKQSWTADKRWSYILGVGYEANNCSP
jgi:hypothetical protein